jgi:hypothetical protein
MIQSSRVERLSEAEIAADLFIHALGFEKRSRAAFSIINDTSDAISLAFPNENRLSYAENARFAKNRGSTIVSDYTAFFRNHFSEHLQSVCSRLKRPPRIAVDISSMNRTMIAEVLLSLLRLRESIESIELMYVPGDFRTPRSEFPEIEQIGAVIPELTGFSADPELPIGVIMGLGYEYGLAVGLINRLEPRLTVCFRATGYDPKYDDACRHANLDFDFGYNETELGSYPLLDASNAYRHLENVVFGMTKGYRVVIVPLGPKIFAALSVLIAIQNLGTVAIWRVAAKLEPADVEPSDDLLRVELNLDVVIPHIQLDLADALTV